MRKYLLLGGCTVFLSILVIPLISCSSTPESTPVQIDSDDVIKIGALFAETGGASFIGKPEADTVRMLVDTINSNGGIHGRKIELLLEDTQGKSDLTYNFASGLIDQGVIGIIGPSTSQNTRRIMDLCEQTETILISCGSSDQIVNPVFPYVFRTPPDTTHAVKTLLATMKEMGFSRVGLISAQAAFGNLWKSTLTELASSYGIDIEYVGGYNSVQANFDDLMGQLKHGVYDAVINAAVGPIQSRVTKAYRNAGLKQPLLQTNAFADIYYVYSAGEAGEGIVFPSLYMTVSESFPRDNVQRRMVSRFKDAYRERYEVEPNLFAAHAYDALMILTNAIEKAGVEKAKVREAVEATKGFVGVGGVYSFSDTDHSGLSGDVFLPTVVRNGTFVLWESSQELPEEAKAIKPHSYLPVLAVLDFTIENMSESEGILIVDYISNAIFKTNRFYVLARNQRENILKEIEYSYSDLADKSTQLEVGKMLAANNILAGSLGKAGSKYLLNLQLIDVETTATHSAVSEIFESIDELLEGCSEIAQEITDF